MIPARQRRSRQRRPGRPSAESSPDVRDSLLTAAGELGASRGLGEVSLRELAQAAGVRTSAARTVTAILALNIGICLPRPRGDRGRIERVHLPNVPSHRRHDDNPLP